MIKVNQSQQDRGLFEIRILPGVTWKDDNRRITDLPERTAIWTESDKGVHQMSHWLIPRVDVFEVMRRFKGHEVISDDRFKRDCKLYRRLHLPVDESKRFTGDIDLPITFKTHQDEYVRIDLEKRRTAALFKTGQGKTYAGLGRAHVLGLSKLLIFTIGVVESDWQAAIRLLFNEEPLIYFGTPQKRKKLLEQAESHRFIIANYQTGYELCQLQNKPDSYIFDEADLALANPDTLKAENLEEILWNTFDKPGIAVQELTATPIGQLPTTAWNLFRFLHPFLAGSRTGFQRWFEQSLRIVERTVAVRNERGDIVYAKRRERASIKFQNKERMGKKLAAVTINVEYKPTYDERVRDVDIDMTDGQLEFFNELKEELKALLGDRTIKIASARSGMMKLLQASEGLFHFDSGLDPYRNAEGSVAWPKVQRDLLSGTFSLSEHTQNESGKLTYAANQLGKWKDKGKKKVIWSRFRFAPLLLYEQFRDSAVLFHGDLTPRQRKLTIMAFAGVNDDYQVEEYRQLLLEHKALEAKHFTGLTFPKKPGTRQYFLGTIADSTARGMNLQCAAHEIYLSGSLSQRVQVQTHGRIARIGQLADVVLSSWYFSDESEKKWRDYVKRKAQDMRISATGDEVLSANQIRDLIRLI